MNCRNARRIYSSFINHYSLIKRQVTQTARMSENRPTILIADEMHPSLFTLLDQAGFRHEYQPAIKRAELLIRLADFDGLIIRSKTIVDIELLNTAPGLRFIGRAGAGLDLIDLEAATARRIAVFHAGEGNRDAVAEHTVGMLLGLLNNLFRANWQVRQGVWDREGNRGYELGSLTVGLLGYGNNGRATAQRLSSFGCRILYTDIRPDLPTDPFSARVTLPELMAEADVLSLHVPLTDETRQLVNDGFISQMAKPFYLSNTARGEIVSLSAVVRGLESGKIRGACLDVLENEKLKPLTEASDRPDLQAAFDYLCQSDRVVLTPHIAGWTHESYVRINEVLVRQLQTVL
jgi:D-3-phosphoglycerate dehydrogenase / 2-oxoglutarate reductase